PRRDEPQTPVGSLDTGSELRSSKRLIKVDYSYLDIIILTVLKLKIRSVDRKKIGEHTFTPSWTRRTKYV
ncbi:unnamed protein product, partial [Nesidiocoris tenuis]